MLFNIQGKLVIIQWSSGSTWFCSISVKLYYSPVTEIDENLNKYIENISLEIYDNPKYQNILPTYVSIDIQSILVPSTSLVS